MDNLADRIANLSPAQLAQLTQQLQQQRQGQSTISLQSRDTQTFPLSFAQQRLWLLHQLQPDSPFYNLPALIRISGPLNLSLLEQSVTTLCDRHEPLRTVFGLNPAGEPVQIIQAAHTWTITPIDLQDLTPQQQQQEVDRQAIAIAKAPFGLAQGPLLRTRLLRLDACTHVLCVCLHHIIADGWALGIFIRELTALYDALQAGRPSPLAPLTVQYVDYGLWQRQRLQGDKGDRHLQYWQQQLQDAPTLLALPTDYPRPPVQSLNGARHPIKLGQPLTQAVKHLGQAAGATVFMTILAAFKVLLYRYTHQQDLLVGTPVANRNQVATEGLIGVLVNTLAIRTQLQAEESFQTLLQQVRDRVIEANTHQDLPFEKLVEVLQPDRSRSYAPLLQVMLTVQNLPLDPHTCGDLTLQVEPLATDTIQFDLMLNLVESADGLQGWLEYNTDIFAAATIERMAQHLQGLLEQVVAAPDCAIAQFSLLTPLEHQLLASWNNTQVDTPAEPSIQQLFEAQVARTPDAIAVVFESQALSYRALNTRANQLAHHLQTLGVTAETLVGVYMERSLEMIVGLLAILKVGGVYVPLDPSYPQARLQFMVEDTQVPVLLTQTQCLAKLPALPAHTIVVDRDWATIAQAPDQNPAQPTITRDHLAYVIYTSGSTGQPKGVCVTHGGVIRLVIDPGYVTLCDRDVFLQLAPISFDAATLEIWGALLNGAKLVLYPKPKPDLDILAAILQQEAVSILWLTAGLFHLVVEQRLDSLTGVKQILAGGDVLSPQQVQKALAALPNATLINGYGPTENTTFTCCYTIPALIEANRSIPIGTPIANTQVYLLDAHLQLVPIGVAGELYIGGDGLARGYWNQPALTADRFIDNPFGPGRLYKSGDLARYLPDGNLEYLGRIDHQVKLRGFRIEPGEIEAVLNRHNQVQQSVVVLREDTPGNKRLVAYIIGDDTLEKEHLYPYLKAQLPDYMVPSTVMPLAAFPLTPNGKVDRQALPTPSDDLNVSPAFVAPQSERQILIANLVATVLALPSDRIGLHDNFFDLGGHSLLAMQLITRLRQTFDVEVPLQALFESPTVAGLDTTLAQGKGNRLMVPAIAPIERDGTPLPLSYAQERLWFLAQLEGVSTTYTIPGAVEIAGRLDIDALQQAIDTLVHRHESLRTTFPTHEGVGVQQIHATMAVPLQMVELGQLSDTLEEWLHQVVQYPFDLATGPLLRVNLRSMTPQSHLLMVTMHHIISDGWSIGVFIQELATLYNTYHQEPSAAASPSTLTRLPIQYADYTHWQRQWLQGAALTAQLGYWQQQLAGAPARLELPTDHPRPAVQSFQGRTYSVTLPSPLTQQVKTLAQHHQVTLFMTLLAAFQVLLSRYSRQGDVAVGTPIANRQQSELEGLIGCFVNTLVLRTVIDERASVSQFLQQVRQICLAAFDHQDVPFEQVVDALQPQRTLAHSPLFQVMFVLQNAPMPALALADVTLRPFEIVRETAQFELTLSMRECEAGLVASWNYNCDLFESQTIERMAGQFETLLTAMVSDDAQVVATLPLLRAAEQSQLLTAWNETAVAYPLQHCLHEWFEQQVVRNPEAIAVVYGQQQLAYGELNQRANQLAHHLRSLGVGPDDLVGICVERSLEMLVGLLAILKAGGAYLPLDPSYPKARLEFMLNDAQVMVVLTQQRLLERLPNSEAQVVCLDRDWSMIDQAPTENPKAAVTPEHLAYVIYTSGSTGNPKGVLTGHRAICNRLLWMQSAYSLTPDDRILQKTPFSFDVSVWEFFWPLWVGATLVVAKPDGHKDSRYLIELMRQQQISTVHFVPSMLAAFLQDPQVHTLTDLKRVICSGEALPLQLQSAFFEQLQCELHNLYGPTEAAIDVTAWPCQVNQENGTIPIGRPIANTQLYILDSALQPVPIGVPGELHIGGVGVAKGYLNRPELTAEKFIPNPFLLPNLSSDSPSASPAPPLPYSPLLYKTGDLARYRPDGVIEYLGRIDHQVKLRGFRIELGEIETVLTQHPQVQQGVVMAREDNPGHQRLVAYVVTEDGDCDENALKADLKAHLPDYMVPAVMVSMTALPLTPNGKIDRRALPNPNDVPRSTVEFVSPQTDLEKTLAQIWQGILGLEPVGIHDNFFALGGDSILSIQMIAQARKVGLSISPQLLFQHQTIGELAHALAGETSPPVIAQQGRVSGSVPLTPIQQWFLDQNWANPHHFNQAILLQVPSDLQVEGLHQSLAYLMLHHDALRLRFEQRASQWHQYHCKDETDAVPLERVDLSHLPLADQGKTLEAIASQQQTNLHLSDGPLWQVVLFNLGHHQPQRLLVILHHLIVDGVSWRILLGDLFDLYHQYLAGQALQLPPKTTAFQDWALQLQAYSQSPEHQTQLEYWLNLPWSAIKALPVDMAAPAVPVTVADTATISVRLSAHATEQLLKQVPQVYNTQINDALLTALAETVGAWVNSNTVLIHLEGHGREPLFEQVDLSHTVGWFTSLYPVLLTVNANASPAAHLKAVKEELRAIPQGGIGYGLLRYMRLDPAIEDALKQLPTPGISFNYLGQIEQGLAVSADWSLASESTGALHSPEGHRAHLLDVNAQVIGGGLQISWIYSRSYHAATTVEHLAQDYLHRLQTLIDHCLSTDAGGYTPSDFPLVDLTQSDLDEVLQQLNL